MGVLRGWCGSGDLEENEDSIRAVVVHTTSSDNIREELVSGEMAPANTILETSTGDVPHVPNRAPWWSVSQLRRDARRRLDMILTVLEVGPSLSVQRPIDDGIHENSAHISLIQNKTHNQPRPLVPAMLKSKPESEVAPMTESMCQQKGTMLTAEEETAGYSSRAEGKVSASAQATSRSTDQLFVAEIRSTVTAIATPNKSAGDSNANEEPASSAHSSAEHFTAAASVKISSEIQVAVKLFYDTGSSDNMIAEKFVKKYRLPERLILANDLIAYHTANGPFVPNKYTELEIRDDTNGMKNFTKVSFKIAPELGAHSLLVGSKFMEEHGFRLSRVEGHGGLFVLTSKPAGKEDKKRQVALIERNKQDQKRAEELKSSSSTSTHGATSKQPSTASYSRTSISSSSIHGKI